MPHLGDPLPEKSDVLGSQVGMITPPHLEFINRFGSQPSDTCLPDAKEGVVVAFVTLYTLLNSQARTGRGGEIGDARNRREVMKWLVGFDGIHAGTENTRTGCSSLPLCYPKLPIYYPV